MSTVKFFNRKLVYLSLSALVTLGIFYYLFTYVSPGDVIQVIKNVDRLSLLLFVLLSLSMSFFRTWRYQVLLNISGYKPKNLALFLVVLVRNFFSDLLPARLGTLIYIYITNSRLGVPLGASTASYAISFIFDILAVIPLILIASLFASSIIEINLTNFLVVILVITVISSLLIYYLANLASLASWFCKKLNLIKIDSFVNDTKTELLKIKAAGVYLRVLVLSLFIRITKYTSLYVFLYALLAPLGYSLAEVKPAESFLGMCAAEFAASLPVSGIAGFGVYEGTWATVFNLLGFPKDIASLTAISHHLFTQVYGYLLGALALILLMLPIFKTKSSQQEYKKVTAIKFTQQIVLSLVVLLLASSFVLFFVEKSNSEETNMNATKIRSYLPDGFPMGIVYDSNVHGSFGIYKMLPENKEAITVINTEAHEIYPDSSPDGSKIVYARTVSLSRLAPASIWIVNSDGSNPKKLAENGTFPTFSADGQKIYFERNRKQVIEMDIDGNKQKKIFPIKGSGFKNFAIVKPRLSADSSRLVFTSDKPKRWMAWSFDFNTKQSTLISDGCEPVLSSSGEEAFWIYKRNVNAGSGIYKFNLQTQEKTVFEDLGSPYGHEYFPTPSQDGKHFLYSACPANQHSHTEANYQIFLKTTKGEAIQITKDKFTNRWPKFLKIS